MEKIQFDGMNILECIGRFHLEKAERFEGFFIGGID